MTVRHLLDVDDLSTDELAEILRLAELPHPPQVLAGRGVALFFEKPSLRTRDATEMAVVQLGGHPVTHRADEVDIDVREPAGDVARVLSGYHALIAARVFEHAKLERMAAAASVPVVNLLSDEAHPLQALADLLTLQQRWGSFAGRTVAYVGDANNVCRSLVKACALAGLDIRVATPPEYQAPDIEALHRPEEAVKDADAVYTDVWASMGQEAEAVARHRAFEGFTVDRRLMAEAADDAVFLHCLPAHRGEEVAAEVVDGPHSVVWHQAHNRMHAARGLFLFLLS
ncbi:MAG TPA: ornithine carbamoyltransferase [Acidimicrobiales bacterium]|nr:ornithine carbamoyltransferase [Acidimicrobiales bacterium]